MAMPQAALAASSPQATANPSVGSGQDGAIRVGEPITGSLGTWSGDTPITLTWQYKDCSSGECINATGDGATGSTTDPTTKPLYTPNASDNLWNLELEVTATNADTGNAAGVVADSPLSAVVVKPALPSGTPVAGVSELDGSVRVGEPVTGYLGSWSGDMPMTLSWQYLLCRSGQCRDATGSGATGTASAADAGTALPTYTPAGADVGSSLELQVSASNDATQPLIPAVAPVVETSQPTLPVTSGPSYWLSPLSMAPTLGTPSSPDPVHDSAMALDAAGNTTVVDIEEQKVGGVPTGGDVLQSRTETADGRWGAPQTIAASPDALSDVHLYSTAAGALTVAYSQAHSQYDASNGQSSTSYTILTAERPAGGTWSAATALAAEAAAPPVEGPFALAGNTEGDAVLAWVSSKAPPSGDAGGPVEIITRTAGGAWSSTATEFDAPGSVPCPSDFGGPCYAQSGLIGAAEVPLVAIDAGDAKASAGWTRGDGVGGVCCNVLYGATFDGTSWSAANQITHYGGDADSAPMSGGGPDQNPTLLSMTEAGGVPTMLLNVSYYEGDQLLVARRGIAPVSGSGEADGTVLDTLTEAAQSGGAAGGPPQGYFIDGQIVSSPDGALAAAWSDLRSSSASADSAYLGGASAPAGGSWGATNPDVSSSSYVYDGTTSGYSLTMGHDDLGFLSWAIGPYNGLVDSQRAYPIGYATVDPASGFSAPQVVDADPPSAPYIQGSVISSALDAHDRANILFAPPQFYYSFPTAAVVRQAVKRAPTLSITSSEPILARPGETLTFTANGNDPAGRTLSYSWDFKGDGSYGDATGKTVTHTFSQAGTYTVEAIATASDATTGEVDTGYAATTQAVAANQPPSGAISSQDFGATVDGLSSVVTGSPVSFDSNATDDRSSVQGGPCGSECTYQWSYDGVAGGTGAIDTHTFKSDGPHTVQVVITDLEGATATLSEQILGVSPGASGAGALQCSDQTWYVHSGKTPRTGLQPYCYDPAGTGQLQVLQPPAHGTLAVAPDGSFTYTPDGTAGDFTAWYEATDGTAASLPAQITLHVLAADVAPTCSDGSSAYPSSALEGSPTSVAANCSDEFGDPLSVKVTTPPAHGTAVPDSTTPGNIIYTPAGGYTGPDSFQYTVSDPFGGVSQPATAYVSVAQPPAPQCSSDAADVTALVGAGDVSPFCWTLASNDPLSYKLLNSSGKVQDTVTTAHGATVTLDPNHAGAFLYTPAAGYSGPDSFQYEALDSYGSISTPATANVQVSAPAAESVSCWAPSLPVGYGAAQTIDLGCTSSKAETLTYKLTTAPQQGMAVPVAGSPGKFTYTPGKDYAGSDSFTVTATDTDGKSATADVSVFDPVTCVPSQIPVTVTGASATIGVTCTAFGSTQTGPTGDPISGWSVVSGGAPAHGTLGSFQPTSSATGDAASATYTPNSGYSGPDSVLVAATDGFGFQSVPAAIQINVAPAVVPPVNTGGSGASSGGGTTSGGSTGGSTGGGTTGGGSTGGGITGGGSTGGGITGGGSTGGGTTTSGGSTGGGATGTTTTTTTTTPTTTTTTPTPTTTTPSGGSTGGTSGGSTGATSGGSTGGNTETGSTQSSPPVTPQSLLQGLTLTRSGAAVSTVTGRGGTVSVPVGKASCLTACTVTVTLDAAPGAAQDVATAARAVVAAVLDYAGRRPAKKHAKKPLVFGATHLKLLPGQSRRLLVALNRAGRATLLKRGRLKVKETIVVRSASGVQTTQTRILELKAPKQKKAIKPKRPAKKKKTPGR